MTDRTLLTYLYALPIVAVLPSKLITRQVNTAAVTGGNPLLNCPI